MPRAAIVAILIAVAAGLVFVLFGSPPCLFYELTGWKCAGCGMTRATRRLLQGDIAGAFRLNALLVAMTPVLAAGAVASPRSFLKPRLVLMIVGVLLAWVVVRNIAHI